jgi:hypothetical protein
LGDLKGAILSRERMAPFARSPCTVQGIKTKRLRRCFFPPLQGGHLICYTFIKSIKKESLL